jgi:hypothetical protein
VWHSRSWTWGTPRFMPSREVGTNGKRPATRPSPNDVRGEKEGKRTSLHARAEGAALRALRDEQRRSRQARIYDDIFI